MKTAIVYYSRHHGNTKKLLDAITKAADTKGCDIVGGYGCLGFNTFGPFKLIGGIAKGHPDQDELSGAVTFFEGILSRS